MNTAVIVADMVSSVAGRNAGLGVAEAPVIETGMLRGPAAEAMLVHTTSVMTVLRMVVNLFIVFSLLGYDTNGVDYGRPAAIVDTAKGAGSPTDAST